MFDLAHESAASSWLDHWSRRLISISGYERLHQYVNYGSVFDKENNTHEAFYGYEDWRLEKLKKLKLQYDPENYWRWYQPLV